MQLFFNTQLIPTPLGDMFAIADEHSLYLLEFTDRHRFEKQLANFQRRSQGELTPGSTPPLLLIQSELEAYFEGHLQAFTTPLSPLGSPFQQQVWKELLQTPYGQTRSYQTQAHALGRPTAVRAVANANGTNPIALVIPCHRILSSDGSLGGYAGGLDRKQWLISHEQKTIDIR